MAELAFPKGGEQAGDNARRIAGDQPDQEEDDNGDPDQRQEGKCKAVHDVTAHEDAEGVKLNNSLEAAIVRMAASGIHLHHVGGITSTWRRSRPISRLA